MKASIVRRHGQLMIDLDGKPFPALAFKSFRPTPENVSDFYAAGVRLFTVLSSGVISRARHSLFPVRRKLGRGRLIRFRTRRPADGHVL